MDQIWKTGHFWPQWPQMASEFRVEVSQILRPSEGCEILLDDYNLKNWQNWYFWPQWPQMTSEVRVEVRHQVDVRSLKIFSSWINHEKYLFLSLFDNLFIVWPLLTSEVTEVNLLLTKTSAHPRRVSMLKFRSVGQGVWNCIEDEQMYRRNGNRNIYLD